MEPNTPAQVSANEGAVRADADAAASKKIYIVLSQSGSNLSRFLKLVTREPYNHASISFREDLETMYSFGRIHPYNPFVGGFVCESSAYGTFKRFKNTRIRVLEVEVSREAYLEAATIIDQMLGEQRRYHYNYLGLILAAVRVPFKKRYCYYCSEFIKYLALRMEIPVAKDLPAIIKPMHLMAIPHRTVYEGILREYKPRSSASLPQA